MTRAERYLDLAEAQLRSLRLILAISIAPLLLIVNGARSLGEIGTDLEKWLLLGSGCAFFICLIVVGATIWNHHAFIVSIKKAFCSSDEMTDESVAEAWEGNQSHTPAWLGWIAYISLWSGYSLLVPYVVVALGVRL